ncbi:MAG: dTDP-4-dehydrorhamnose 3,5-epimerase [Desulfobacteraceae bacterium]|nr:MAG: dTDP-4-dehydrorhamnose 3,5-epimerase [Desulfobacteraceae bacterium]
MKIMATALPGVLLLEPRVFADPRGFFMETYHRQRYEEAGIQDTFVQDNFSHSAKNVLRGLHYQRKHAQAKLVQVIKGVIFDGVVDIRPNSPCFGRWTGEELSEFNGRQIYVPKGFAHGFCVLSESADVLYKCSDFYDPTDEGGIIWCDPDIGIQWPISVPLLSEKDSQYPGLRSLDLEKL